MRGSARVELGDAGGLDDLRRAIDLATERGEGWEGASAYNNYASAIARLRGPAEAIEAYREGILFARSRGMTYYAITMAGGRLVELMQLGRFDDILHDVAALASGRDADAVVPLMEVHVATATTLALRGRAREALPNVDKTVMIAQQTSGADTVVEGLASAAVVWSALGDFARAVELLEEIQSRPGLRDTSGFGAFLPSTVRVAVAAGNRGLAERLAEVTPHTPLDEHAVVAARASLDEAAGHDEQAAQGYADAAKRWERVGLAPERGFALLGLGRCLIRLGRSVDALDAFTQAQKIFMDLGMSPALAETDAALTHVAADAS
jgi:tetratricopeptide (TPR) repeat protein